MRSPARYMSLLALDWTQSNEGPEPDFARRTLRDVAALTEPRGARRCAAARPRRSGLNARGRSCVLYAGTINNRASADGKDRGPLRFLQRRAGHCERFRRKGGQYQRPPKKRLKQRPSIKLLYPSRAASVAHIPTEISYANAWLMLSIWSS